MGDILAPTETRAANPGQVVVNTGAAGIDTWQTWANVGNPAGFQIGILAAGAIPGGPIQAITIGRVPYNAFNVGAGAAGTVVAANVAFRGNASQGIVIGTCDPSGEITLQQPVLLGSGFPVNPVQGDLVYYNGTNWTLLAPGTSTQFLQSGGPGANPGWGGISGLPSSAVQGDLVYYNGTAWVVLTPGTNGQFLQTQGPVANPQWAPVATFPAISLSTVSALEQAGSIASSNIFAGSTGNSFYVTAAGHQCTGCRFYWAGGNTTIKASLWNSVTGARVVSASAAISSVGEHTISFGSPPTLTTYLPYTISIADMAGSGTVATYSANAGAILMLYMPGVTQGGPWMYWCTSQQGSPGTTSPSCYTNSQDAVPTTNYSNDVFPVDPVLV